MHTIDIQSFRVRYRLTRRDDASRRRLDRVLGLVVDGALERAIERAGIAPGEEVCIRRLSHAVRLRLQTTDQAMADAWGDEFTAALRAASSHPDAGSRSEIVRFPSRAHGLVDMALAVASGNQTRAWAWRQLGLWPDDEPVPLPEAARRAAAVLAREPALVVPTLVALARRGLLPGLARHWVGAHWNDLARAAAAAAGTAIPPRELAAVVAVPRAEKSPRDAGAARAAAALAARSWLARALDPQPLPESSTMPLAVLVLLELDPMQAARPRTEFLSLVDRVRHALAEGMPRSDATGAAPRPPRAAPRDPARVAMPTTPRSTAPESVPATPDVAPGTEGTGPAFTAHGGLLFLIGVVGRLGLPARLAETLPERPLRRVLHALARRLVPVAADDPVALAFSGLAPGDPPPIAGEGELPEDEAPAVEAAALEIAGDLRRRLAGTELPPDEILAWVCARRAAIVPGPGSLDAVFSLDDVSTELRRAGLDLDPGYVPWLGVTLRFLYE